MRLSALTVRYISDLNIIKVIHYDFARGMVVLRRHFSIPVGHAVRYLSVNGSIVAVPLIFDFTYFIHLRSHHGREEGLHLRLINIPVSPKCYINMVQLIGYIVGAW